MILEVFAPYVEPEGRLDDGSNLGAKRFRSLRLLFGISGIDGGGLLSCLDNLLRCCKSGLVSLLTPLGVLIECGSAEP